MGALVDSLLIVDAGSSVDSALGLDPQHRAPTVKAEVQRHAPVAAGVGERPMHRLPVGDRHVARLADDGHRVGQAL